MKIMALMVSFAVIGCSEPDRVKTCIRLSNMTLEAMANDTILFQELDAEKGIDWTPGQYTETHLTAVKTYEMSQDTDFRTMLFDTCVKGNQGKGELTSLEKAQYSCFNHSTTLRQAIKCLKKVTSKWTE